MVILRFYLVGFVILIIAIAMNMLARGFGVATWYDFLNQVSDIGLTSALQHLHLFDYLFLILIYPLVLGGAAFLTFYLTRSW